MFCVAIGWQEEQRIDHVKKSVPGAESEYARTFWLCDSNKTALQWRQGNTGGKIYLFIWLTYSNHNETRT